MDAVSVWKAARILRWTVWIAFIGYVIYFMQTRASHFNEYGQISTSTNLAIFGLGIGCFVTGLFEMAMRDWTGIPRRPR